MSHVINSFAIDVPPVSAVKFRIDPQPPREDPWTVLDDYEYQAQYKLGDRAQRYAENGTWYLLAVDPDTSRSEIRLNGNTKLTREGTIELQESEEQHRKLIAQTLRDELEWYLTEELEYWETGNSQNFYERNPSTTVSGYDAYHGYRTRINYENGFYLTVDTTVKFISSLPVSYYLEKVERDKAERKLLDRYCTLMSADRPRVKLLSVADDLTVSDETIEQDDGETVSVVDYLDRDSKYPDAVVNDVDPAEPLAQVRFGWMDESESADTAPSLLYPNPRDINADMQGYSSRPADERWADTREFVEQINFLRVGDEFCDVADRPRKQGLDEFDYPALRFGQRQQLIIGDDNRVDHSQTVNNSNWHFVVKDYLGEFGAASKPRGAPVIDLLHPEGRRDTALEVYDEIRQYVEDYTGLPMEANPGTVAHDDRQKLREWIQRHGNTCDGVLVVFESQSSSYHDIITELDGVPAQGIRVGTYRSAMRSNRDFDGKLFTTAVGLATKVGVRPYLLDDGLNADVTIGMSVKGDETNTAAAVLISGETGDLVYQTESNFATGSSTATEQDVARRITTESIADAADRGVIDDPDSIVIQKNGPFGDGELNGIEAGIGELFDERYLTGEVDWGAVQLSERSEHRIYSDQRRDCVALTGAYANLGSTDAVITTYGAPDIHQGTPNPIHCSVEEMHGDIPMEAVAADIFGLTFLNWGSPLARMKSPLSTHLPGKMHELLATGARIPYPPF